MLLGDFAGISHLDSDDLEGKEIIINGLEQGDALRKVTRDVFDRHSRHVLDAGIGGKDGKGLDIVRSDASARFRRVP